MGYSGRTSELPCLRVFASHHTLLEVDGPEAISRICTGPGGVSNLAKQLREAAERSALVAVIGRADKQRRQKEQYDRHTMHLRNAHFIRKRYKCIVFDCEGVLKKPINKTLQRGHKFDSWCSASRGCKDCVPFMSQLLLPRDVVDQLGLCPAQSQHRLPFRFRQDLQVLKIRRARRRNCRRPLVAVMTPPSCAWYQT
jgi:hypothetical protein